MFEFQDIPGHSRTQKKFQDIPGHSRTVVTMFCSTFRSTFPISVQEVHISTYQYEWPPCRTSCKTIYLAAYSSLFDKHSTLCPVDSSHLRKAVESVPYQITPVYSCMNVCFGETIRWPMVRFFTHLKHKMIQVSILKIQNSPLNTRNPPFPF